MSETIAVMAFITLILLLIVVFMHLGRKHNKTNWDSNFLNLLDGFNFWFCKKYHRLPDKLITLPADGPMVLISNHISGLDPLLLIAATNRPLRFMIAQEEYDRWWLKWLFVKVGCIPVNRTKNPRKALKKSIEALEKGEVLVVFPQGGIVANKTIKPLKQGAFLLAKLANVQLSVVRIEGVFAKGLTISSVFFRSKINICQDKPDTMVTDVNIARLMQQVNQFFLS